MPISPEEYFKNREVVNRCSARNILGVSGSELNLLLAQHGYIRAKELGNKKYKRAIRCKEPETDTTLLEPKASISWDIPVQKDNLILISYLINSQVYLPFWKNLLKFAAVQKAEICVIPMRYRNPTTLEESIKQEEDETIDPLVLPFLKVKRFDHGMTTVLADIKVNPTNLEPLNTLAPFSFGKHLVVGHTVQQIKPLTTGRSESTLTMWSTGSCSVPELSDSLAGKKAELHHRYGFVFLTKNSIRSIHARRDGSFIDQAIEYTVDLEQPKFTPAEACVLGDLHYGQQDNAAYLWARQTAKERGAVKLFLNDSFDGSTCNHHDLELSSRTRFFDFVSEELANHRKEMAALRSKGFEPYLVASNHTDFLTRWASETDRSYIHRKDIDLYDEIKTCKNQDISKVLEWHLGAKTLPEEYTCCGFSIKHGHERFNGARGSIKSFTQTGNRTAYGHTHKVESSLGQENIGCLCVLQQDYNEGYSSWIHAIGVLYPNNKIQIEIKW